VLIAAVLPTWGGMAATIKEPSEPRVPDQAFGPTETIRASLTALLKEQRLIVVKGDSGVVYNFKVTSATKIEIGGKKAGFEDLDSMINTNISVTFVPMPQGNVARKIQVGL